MAAVLTLSCGTGKPFVIGFAASLSGNNYQLGLDGRNAAELYVRDVNSAGGINGRQVRLVIRDLGSTPSRVPTAVTELIHEGAKVIVGFYTSTEAVAAIEAARGTGVPLVSPAATASSLTGKDDGFYRTIMSSEGDAPILAGHMKSRGLTRVLILGATGNATYVDTYAIPLGSLVTVVGDIRFGSTAGIDWQNIGAIHDSVGYDAVLIIASALDTGALAQELNKRGLSAPLYASGWAGNKDVIEYGGKSVEGLVFVHQIDTEAEGVRHMAARYQEVFRTQPSFSAIQTWESMEYVCIALRQARGRSGQFAGALASIRSFQGLIGTITMDESGDASRKAFLKRVAKGSIIVDTTGN